MKILKNHLFKNWASNVRFTVSNFYQPEHEADIIEIVRKHEKVRMVGSGHSWSDVCCTNDALINLDKYNKILHIDKSAKTVTVQAGIKLWQLNEQLDKAGLALVNLGSIDRQSLAGAVSTGTHGTGINFSILAAQIVSFDLIKADGEKISISKNKGENLFNACVVNLGALGIVSEITLQATEAFNLHDRTETIDFDEVIENIDAYIDNNDHFKMWWLPPTKKVVVYRYKRTHEPCNDSPIRQFVRDKLLSVYVYRSLVFIGKILPALSKAINELLIWDLRKPLNRIEKSYKVFIVPEPPLHRETEWAFDRKNAKEILKAYKQLLTENDFRLNFIQEIRFTKADNFWLSASYQRSSIWLGLYAYNHEKWNDILPQFEVFAQKHGGRPHWGKEFSLDKNYLRQQHPKIDDFAQVKNELDPNRKFENHFIEKIFG
jgi:FAD/FMN-containing dehydrogenase